MTEIDVGVQFKTGRDYYFKMTRTGQWTYEMQRYSKNYHHRLGKPIKQELVHPPQCPNCKNFHEYETCPACKNCHDYGECPE